MSAIDKLLGLLHLVTVRERDEARCELATLKATLREHGAHTTQCLVNAALTRRSFCIAPCADRWRPLLADNATPCASEGKDTDKRSEGR